MCHWNLSARQQNIPRNVHHVHLWQVGEKNILTLHVQVVPNYQHDELLQRIHRWLQQNYPIAHITVQTEYQLCAEIECRLAQAEDGDDGHDHKGHSHHPHAAH